MDHIISAKINLIGMLFDSLGGLYLAYDLLGGEKGPLKLITRFITYSLLLFVLYDLFFGFKFAILGGFGLGLILSTQFYLINRYNHISKSAMVVFTLLTAIVLGTSMSFRFGREFGLWFIFFNSLFVLVFSSHYVRIIEVYIRISDKTRKRKFELVNYVPAMLRGFVVGTSTLLASWMVYHSFKALTMGLIIGLIASIIGTAVTISVPYIERFVDNLPDRTLGMFGISLFIVGFFLQSIQYIEILWKID